MFAGEVDLKTSYKPDLDNKILKDLSKRSDVKGIIDISIYFLALLLSGYLCIISWGSWWCIPALLLYGNIFYCKACLCFNTINFCQKRLGFRLSQIF